MMKKHSVKILFLSLTAILILAGGWYGYQQYTAETEEAFEDLPPDHWAYETIMWAVERGIIMGYSDGTILPNKPVTEVELLAMLFRTFERHQPELDGAQESAVINGEDRAAWAGEYYRKALSLNWDIWGQPSRNQIMSRIDFARILTNALGYNLSEDGAIQTMLDLGLVEGQKNPTVDGFGRGELTRSEALKVLKKLDEMGFESLQARPRKPSPEPEIKSNFLTTVEPVLQVGEELGYQTRALAWASEVGFSQDGQGIIYLSYRDAQSPYNQIVLYQADRIEHRQTVQKMLEALGIELDNEFLRAMSRVKREGKSVYYEAGQWEFRFNPGNVEEYVEINFRKKK